MYPHPNAVKNWDKGSWGWTQAQGHVACLGLHHCPFRLAPGSESGMNSPSSTQIPRQTVQETSGFALDSGGSPLIGPRRPSIPFMWAQGQSGVDSGATTPSFHTRGPTLSSGTGAGNGHPHTGVPSPDPWRGSKWGSLPPPSCKPGRWRKRGTGVPTHGPWPAPLSSRNPTSPPPHCRAPVHKGRGHVSEKQSQWPFPRVGGERGLLICGVSKA